MAIDWDSPRWGEYGQNVHDSEWGSWLPEKMGNER